MARFWDAATEVASALRPLKTVLAPVMVMSAVLNILMLGGSFFMLLVYDDVLPSRSIPTLVGLIVMIVMVYAFQAALDMFRSRVMIQVGALVDQQLAPRIYDVITSYELSKGPMRDGTQPVRDLDQLRGFLTGPGPLAFLDLPWVLLYLGVLTVFHWTLGLVTLAGAITLFSLTLVSDRVTRERTQQMTAIASARFTFAESSRRNADMIRALGMTGRLRESWCQLSDAYLFKADQLAESGGRMQGVSKTFRMLLQSMILAVGATLVINGSATGGVIIAGSILSARALAPIEQTIASWRNLIAMRQAWDRLNVVITQTPVRIEPMPLPDPKETLAVSSLTSGPPGSDRATIGDVTFTLNAGDAVAIIGPSGSGKSSLIKAVVGVWPTLRGSIRLDGASLDQWGLDVLGRNIGYVPQSIELFDGTVAQNISRFDPDSQPEDVLAAAKAADVHDLIVQLPEGYEHRLGPSGGNLSAGQRQRIALARALYRDPFLIALDEPNSNLDNQGEAALGKAIEAARRRGAIVLVVAHRPAVLQNVDYIMSMALGRISAMGTRDDLMKKLGFRELTPIPAETPAIKAAS